MKRLFIAMIKFYQKYISPMKHTKCPYFPNCSSYGIEAIEKYGVWKGGMLALWRILRCNPFSKGGYDPVPLKVKNPDESNGVCDPWENQKDVLPAGNNRRK